MLLAHHRLRSQGMIMSMADSEDLKFDFVVENKFSCCSNRTENQTAKLQSYISVCEVRTNGISLPMQTLIIRDRGPKPWLRIWK
jgi:hypothetical protein